MNWIKNNLGILWPLLTGVFLVLWLQQCNKEPEVIKIPVEKIIKIPEVTTKFDTIVPEPEIKVVKQIDSSIYKEYLKLKEGTQKDSAFKEAIAIKEYNVPFEDSLQLTNVYTKTRGEILEQSITTTLKERELVIRDTIRVSKKGQFNIGGGVGIPLADPLNNRPVIKAELMFINKKGNTFSVSYDTQGTVWATKTIKIF